MEDEVRVRMKQALELKGLNPYEVSMAVGLHRNYLWESFDLKRRKGTLDRYQKVARHIGLRMVWLTNGEGEPFPTSTQSLDRERFLVAL
jgi:hypothetical protein